jgi:hypothetical protein
LPQNENSVEWMIMFTAIFVLLWWQNVFQSSGESDLNLLYTLISTDTGFKRIKSS